jgi:hypothetical protein
MSISVTALLAENEAETDLRIRVKPLIDKARLGLMRVGGDRWRRRGQED